jgi:hypothetical protein
MIILSPRLVLFTALPKRAIDPVASVIYRTPPNSAPFFTIPVTVTCVLAARVLAVAIGVICACAKPNRLTPKHILKIRYFILTVVKKNR